MSAACRQFLLLATLAVAAACSSPEPAASAVAVINRGAFVASSGEVVQAEYRADDTVALQFADGRRKQLPLAISASGARYATDDEEWWEHQGEATYSVNDQPVFIGRRQAAPQLQP